MARKIAAFRLAHEAKFILQEPPRQRGGRRTFLAYSFRRLPWAATNEAAPAFAAPGCPASPRITCLCDQLCPMGCREESPRDCEF